MSSLCSYRPLLHVRESPVIFKLLGLKVFKVNEFKTYCKLAFVVIII